MARAVAEAADDGGEPHGLAWKWGAGALRTGWKLIGVAVYASGDVRGEPCSKIQVDWCS